MRELQRQVYRFNGFEVDAMKRQLLRDGQYVQLGTKAFDLLIFLIENRGRELTKEELLEKVWQEQFVEEANLPVQIAALRKALGESKGEPKFIRTLPRRGYQFIADVYTEDDEEELLIEQHTVTRLVVESEIVNDENAKPYDAANNSSNGFTQNKVTSYTQLPSAQIPTTYQKKSRYTLFAVGTAIVLLAFSAVGYWGYKTSNGNHAGRQFPFQRMSIKRLTTNGNVTAITLTPDGRYAVFAKKEADGESLWLRQIETGSQTRVMPAQNLEYLGLTVSPDGNFVYAPVFLANEADTPLLKIPILGGGAQEIPNVVTSAAISFSPDGKHIAYVEPHRPETHLYIANSDGTNKRILIRSNNAQRELANWKANPVAWSQDGKMLAVAYNENSVKGSLAGVLLVNPSDGSEKVIVPPRWAFVEYVAWIDAEHIVFTGYEDDWLNQIWTVSLGTGEMRQITSSLEKSRWLAVAGGNLLTVQVNAVSSIYMADFAEGTKAFQPREILRESGYVISAVRGRANEIFYSSRTTGKWEIWRVGNDGASPTQITSGANTIFGLAVSPVADSLVFTSYQNGKYSLWTVDTDGRNLRLLSDGEKQIFPEIAPDGTIVFQEGDYGISRIAPGSNTSVPLAKGVKPTLSPDGRQTAFFLMDEGKWRIGIMETDSGKIIKKLDLPTFISERRMRWHPSGKFITIIYSGGENLNLLLLPVEGGETHIIENLGKGDINSFSWSADGRQILYSVTNETQDAVWLNGS